MSGWFRTYRSVFEHQFFEGDEFSPREAWLWLIAKAAWKDTTHRIGGEVHSCPRGALFITLRGLAATWNWASEKRVRGFLNSLENGRMIERRTDAGKTLVIICNYDEYQSEDERADASRTQGAPQAGRKQDALKEEGKKKEYPLTPTGEGRGLFQDQIPEEPKAPAIDIEAKFEEFRKAYPPREGTNPRKPAWEKFHRLVKAGQDPDAIIAGAKAYCAQQVALGKAGTPYIKQVIVWLNQECWRDEYPMPQGKTAQQAPVTSRSMPDNQWSTYLDRFKNGLPWPDFCGPAPGQAGCRAPPELLKKFGLEPKNEIRH